jgi:hypothetical protein
MLNRLVYSPYARQADRDEVILREAGWHTWHDGDGIFWCAPKVDDAHCEPNKPSPIFSSYNPLHWFCLVIEMLTGFISLLEFAFA